MKRLAAKLYFDPDILDWLKAEAKRRRCSVGALVRRLALDAMERSGVAT